MITVEQQANDVVASANGSVNLAGFGTSPGAASGRPNLWPSLFYGSGLTVGSIQGGSYDVYSGIAGPASFGSGPQVFADSGSGENFGIIAHDSLYVPQGYLTESMLTGTATWANHTLADLGLIPGTYTWTWGSGANADSATLTIVPEPRAYSLLTGLALLGVSVWRRRACR